MFSVRRNGILYALSINSSLKMRCAMVKAVSCWSPTMEAQLSFQASPCEVYGGKRDTGTDFSSNTYNSTNAPYLS